MADNEAGNSKSEQKGLLKKLKDSVEFLTLITLLITSITFILSKIGYLGSIKENLFLIFVDSLNIIILLCAIFLIKPLLLSIEPDEWKNLKKHLKPSDKKNFTKIEPRVNELVAQLVDCIQKFAGVLGVFYILQLIIDCFQYFNSKGLPEYKCLKPAIDNSNNIIELISYIPDPKILIPEGCQYVARPGIGATIYLSLETLTNATNLFSAAYLFLAFQVLFIVTLENDDKTWRFKKNIPFGLAYIITILNAAFFIVGIPETHLSVTAHTFRLIGGIYNGIAMFLLFSRFVSMEYFFKSSNDRRRKYYLYGTILILPAYVVVQPLYGVINAIEFGADSPTIFKSFVFLICFWGKLVFLLFVYTMLKKKWLHAYLFLLLSQNNTLSIIAEDIKDVDDLEHPNNSLSIPASKDISTEISVN